MNTDATENEFHFFLLFQTALKGRYKALTFKKIYFKFSNKILLIYSCVIVISHLTSSTYIYLEAVWYNKMGLIAAFTFSKLPQFPQL